MKKYLKILSMMLITFIGLNTLIVKAASGEITIDKQANKSDEIYGRTAHVKLEVQSKDYKLSTQNDIILVIDRSTSMNNKANEKDTLTKIQATKKAAKTLVNNLITDNSNVRIGVVVFGSDLINKLDLSSNKNQIIQFIDNIKDININQGTNVQIGLKTANDMLENKNNQYIILLTDGQPTFYTDENGIRHGAGGADLYECTDWDKRGRCIEHDGPKPSEKAIAEAEKIKDNATIYTIAFNSLETQTFLNQVASPNGSYTADDEEELLEQFENIYQNISLIATNVVVTDIVPDYFKLDIDSLKQQYGTNVTTEEVNGKTVITWTIGNLYSTNIPTLEYDVEAILPHYGNMYTNTEATLKGVASDGNPVYINGDINLTFPKPDVNIPAVTVDDDYATIYQGKELKVSSILKNDYLTKNEEVAKVSDEIIVINKSHESLNDLVINDDGSFNYQAPNDYKGKISFEYYIKSTILKNGVTSEVISNTSKVTWEVVAKETNYTVNYLEKGTDKVLNDSKIEKGYEKEEVTEKAIEIEGYEAQDPKEVTIELKAKDNVINFYYEKKQPLIEATLEKTGTDKIETIDSLVKYQIKYSGSIKDFKGDFKLIITDKLPYEIDLSKSNLNGGIYKDQTITWEIAYNDVNTYQNGSLNLNFVKDIEVLYSNIDPTISDLKNKVIVTIEGIQTEKLTAEFTTDVAINGTVDVWYLDEEGNSLADFEQLTGKCGSDYQTKAKNIEGYHLLKVEGKENGQYNLKPTTIKYIYSLNKGILTIKYVDNKGNELLESSIRNGIIGTRYQTEAAIIDGYKLLKIDGNENGVFSKNETVVTYIYESESTIPFTKVIANKLPILGIITCSILISLLLVFRKRILNHE